MLCDVSFCIVSAMFRPFKRGELIRCTDHPFSVAAKSRDKAGFPYVNGMG